MVTFPNSAQQVFSSDFDLPPFPGDYIFERWRNGRKINDQCFNIPNVDVSMNLSANLGQAVMLGRAALSQELESFAIVASNRGQVSTATWKYVAGRPHHHGNNAAAHVIFDWPAGPLPNGTYTVGPVRLDKYPGPIFVANNATLLPIAGANRGPAFGGGDRSFDPLTNRLQGAGGSAVVELTDFTERLSIT
jgi:hypothetical protein